MVNSYLLLKSLNSTFSIWCFLLQTKINIIWNLKMIANQDDLSDAQSDAAVQALEAFD